MYKLILICSTLLLSACSAGLVATGEVTPQQGSQQAQLQVNNELLASRVRIAEINHTYAGNLLRVDVALENLWRFELDFEYKFKWYDSNGFEINTDGKPWKKIVLRGREVEHVQSVAPNPSATQFKIYVQD